MKALRCLLLAGTAVASAAQAQDTRDVQQEIWFINGQVPPLCLLGELTNANGEFAMGVLSDSITGLLRRDLAAPSKRIAASFCNSPSQLSIEAEEMLPVDAGGTPREGFGRRVNFVATASGWTDQPATYDTSGPVVQPTAVRLQPQPREGDIIIDVSDFEMQGGSGIRPVASRRYQGTVTVTLAPTP